MITDIESPTYKPSYVGLSLTYLVFYREGTWIGSGRNYSRSMPPTWETAVLKGDDPRWAFWNNAGVREYRILAATDDPEGDAEFQQYAAKAYRIRRPDILYPFDIKWYELDTITVGMVRKAVQSTKDWNERLRAATSSPLLREALALVANTPSVNVRARRLAAAVLAAGGSVRGLEVAERIAKLRLPVAETTEAAREAVRSKRAERDVLARYGKSDGQAA